MELSKFCVVSGGLEREEGVNIHYEVYGTGTEKLMLIIGLASSGRLWYPNVSWFLKNAPEYQICIYDNRGIGKSSVPKGKYTTAEMAQDVLAISDEIKWDIFHVVGNSMGGMIAQELALAAPERICSLHLSSTFPKFKLSYLTLGGIIGQTRVMLGKTERDKKIAASKMLYPKAYLNEETEGTKNIERTVAILLDSEDGTPPDPNGIKSQTSAVFSHKLSTKRLKALKETKIPIMVSTGDIDTIISPVASHDLVQALEPAEFVIWEGVGHATINQNLEEFNAAVLRHCARGCNKDTG